MSIRGSANQIFLFRSDSIFKVEEELASRGVKAMTFFDVVLDYILLDAFDDLDQPPSSVTAVVQNRWLSSGFKETALATAVWSLLKAKRHRLTQPNGFMAHFYAISEHISPLMAWGFLGSDEELRKMCLYFKTPLRRSIFTFVVISNLPEFLFAFLPMEPAVLSCMVVSVAKGTIYFFTRMHCHLLLRLLLLCAVLLLSSVAPMAAAAGPKCCG
ncbi:hypothetical protein J437_LFUL013338 [Ladona fulva]|uniref:Uncharacterized protein n=1 Tax=Ladona fulva TaxID=123851 RepID=A0A8K0KMH1_LADFU|nr:hypothetical protein J437_LFUL013338 [Ladona fulva]